MNAAKFKKEDFVKGRFVRVRSENLDKFIAASAMKLKDRIGVVVGFKGVEGGPIVQFPQVNRRLAFSQTFSTPENTLEILTDETEIASFKATVLATEKRRIARTKSGY